MKRIPEDIESSTSGKTAPEVGIMADYHDFGVGLVREASSDESRCAQNAPILSLMAIKLISASTL